MADKPGLDVIRARLEKAVGLAQCYAATRLDPEADDFGVVIDATVYLRGKRPGGTRRVEYDGITLEATRTRTYFDAGSGIPVARSIFSATTRIGVRAIMKPSEDRLWEYVCDVLDRVIVVLDRGPSSPG